MPTTCTEEQEMSSYVRHFLLLSTRGRMHVLLFGVSMHSYLAAFLDFQCPYLQNLLALRTSVVLTGLELSRPSH